MGSSISNCQASSGKPDILRKLSFTHPTCQLGYISMSPEVFGLPHRGDLLQRVVVYQLAKKRAGTAKTKTRAEVRGGGRYVLILAMQADLLITENHGNRKAQEGQELVVLGHLYSEEVRLLLSLA